MHKSSAGAMVLSCGLLLAVAQAQTNWPRFGNDPGASRYSPLTQIDTGNVDRLQLAWKFDTTVADAAPPKVSEVQHGDAAAAPARRFHFRIHRLSESEPVVVNDVLYMSTGFGHVVALNAERTSWVAGPPAISAAPATG